MYDYTTSLITLTLFFVKVNMFIKRKNPSYGIYSKEYNISKVTKNTPLIPKTCSYNTHQAENYI